MKTKPTRAIVIYFLCSLLSLPSADIHGAEARPLDEYESEASTRKAGDEAEQGDFDLTRPRQQPSTFIRITIRTSRESGLVSTLDIYNASLVRSMESAGVRTPDKSAAPMLQEDIQIELFRKGASRRFDVTTTGALIDTANRQTMLLPEQVRGMLDAYAAAVRGSHYGTLAPWQQAKTIVPRKMIVTVTDLETGMRFRAQRRAGSNHADMQPITKEDAHTMHAIYGGRWSWNRRAVIVDTGKQRIAASMNGMPHGGDGIPDNDFKGHFCIHFLDSRTHRSRSVDAAHQAMVYKAAGQLESYVRSLSPVQLTELLLLAVNQKDNLLLHLVYPHPPEGQPPAFDPGDPKLATIRVVAPPSVADANNPLERTITVRAAIQREGERAVSKKLRIVVKRASETAPWIVERVDAEAEMKKRASS